MEYFPTQSHESFLNLFWISVALMNLKIKKTLELTETNITKLMSILRSYCMRQGQIELSELS